MARKLSWTWIAAGVVVVVIVLYMMSSPLSSAMGCPGSQIYCPGVGCVSGQDKCFPGAVGGPSKVFSKETFVNKKCPDGTRTDGPCLLDF